jgi:hypothetical protein
MRATSLVDVEEIEVVGELNESPLEVWCQLAKVVSD